MNLAAPLLRRFGALLVLIACTGAARAADLSHAVMLVATQMLAGSSYEETVVLAAPLPLGGHMGFIVNRPTNVKLETLFPEHTPSRKVAEPVYLGGPFLSDGLFAVARSKPEGDGEALEIMPGVFAVFDGTSIDRLIESTPNATRYFAGLMAWAPGELDEEIHAGAWDVRPARADFVLGGNTATLWKALSARKS